jgi:choline dehydrogenase-like flavoprotein
MGKDPKKSVVGPNLRSHEVQNLLITDASVFPSSGGGDAPSLTIEAVSLRAADLLIENIKKG